MKALPKGILAALVVLLLIPIGHTIMVLTELVFPGNKFLIAGLIGLAGVVLLYGGVRMNEKPVTATMTGFLGGVLVWTGWVEFSFVWIAESLKVSPLKNGDEIVTKSEYLVMMSSTGLLLTLVVFILFSQTGCHFFRWFQRRLRLKNAAIAPLKRPVAAITFFETVMVIWTFYILLLLAYDENIAGTYHPFTYVVGLGSLLWSLYLFRNLLRIQKTDQAIRYAIPTVVIFWNFVEILGRWDLLNEIWVDPFGHMLENILIVSVFAFFTVWVLVAGKRKRA